MTQLRFDRRLDDAERDLLCWLTVRSVIEQTGCTWEAATAALERFTEEGRASFRGDAFDVYVEIAGHTLIHCERDWLAFHAHADDWERQDSPSDREA